MPRSFYVTVLGVVTICLNACAAGATSDDPSVTAPGDTAEEAGAATGHDGGTTSPGADGASAWTDSALPEAGANGCATGAGLVYVLGKTNELYSFDPASLQLSKVASVSCPQTGTATPFSMAVDRRAVAWVLFNDGHLFHVDINTGVCSATSFQPGQSGFTKFGMGFVSNSPGSQDETLYVANEYGIGSIDTSTLALTPAGGTFGFSAAAELTGTGDARLFGLFYGFPPYISEIDKTSSALLGEMPLDTVDIGTGFAYAFWGGSFWVFTAPNGTSSQIDRFDPLAGGSSTTLVVPSVGFKIVGAGVSTCAPITAPK